MCQHCDGTHAHGSTPKAIAPAPIAPLVIGEQLPLDFVAAHMLPAIAKRDDEGNEIDTRVACSSCGDMHEPEDLRPHCTDDEQKLCDDCSISCEGCGNIYHTDDDDDIHECTRDRSSSRNRTTSFRCESGNCGAFKCADCSDWFYDHDGASNADGNEICLQCAESYCSCEDCSAVIHNDNSRYVESRGVCVCESCYDESGDDEDSDDEEEEQSESSRKLIHDYDYKPSPQFFAGSGERTNPLNPYFGIELETEGGETDEAIRSSGLVDDSLFYVKHDGSLKDGFEIVSHPATFRHWMEHDLSFTDKLRKAGYRSYDTDTCGMHVHVSKSALTQAQRAKLLLWAKVNRAFVLYVSRRESATKLNDWASVDLRSTGGLIRKACGDYVDRDERYTAVNLLPAKTIEFRIFRGTLNIASIRRNIALVACIVAFIRNAPLSAMSHYDLRQWIVRDGKHVIGKEMVKSVMSFLDGFNGGIAPVNAEEERLTA
jgi:hypothetical protein